MQNLCVSPPWKSTLPWKVFSKLETSIEWKFVQIWAKTFFHSGTILVFLYTSLWKSKWGCVSKIDWYLTNYVTFIEIFLKAVLEPDRNRHNEGLQAYYTTVVVCQSTAINQHLTNQICWIVTYTLRVKYMHNKTHFPEFSYAYKGGVVSIGQWGRCSLHDLFGCLLYDAFSKHAFSSGVFAFSQFQTYLFLPRRWRASQAALHRMSKMGDRDDWSMYGLWKQKNT